MPEELACLIAFLWGSLVCLGIFVCATKARCGKQEKCLQAWKDIVYAPDWRARIGVFILHSPLLLVMSVKSFALAMGGLIVTMVGAVCDYPILAWLTKWLDRALEWLFGSAEAPPITGVWRSIAQDNR